MQTFSIIFITLTAILGLLKILLTINGMNDVLERVEEFLVKLNEYVSSGGKNFDSYDWLVENADWLQAYLGDMGIAAAYKPPFASHVITNYPIVVNTIPELRQSIEQGSRASREHYMTLRDTVIRYRGILKVRMKSLFVMRRNPVRWFIEGVKWILSFPLIFLDWAGVLSSVTVSRIEHSIFFRLISGIFALVGFISSVLTIVVEWDTIVSFLSRIMK